MTDAEYRTLKLLDHLEEVFFGYGLPCARGDHVPDDALEIKHPDWDEFHRVTYNCLVCDVWYDQDEDCSCARTLATADF